MKKFLLVLLCLIMLSSCSISGEEVISYGDIDISENIFFFELALRKTNFLSSVLGTTTDNPLIWSQKSGDTTIDEAMKNIAVEECCKLAFFADWAKDNGYDLTVEEKAVVSATLADMEAQFDSRAALNVYFEPYSMNYDLYEEYCNLQMLSQKGLAYYYNQNGEDPITEDEMLNLYDSMFITVKHIFINTVAAGADASGNIVELTEEEKQIRLAAVDDIMTALDAGISFDDYYEITQDSMYTSYPNGYTITQGIMGMAEYEAAAFDLDVNEYVRVDIEDVGTYIIKRVPTLEEDFANCYSYILQMLLQTKSSLLIESMIEEFDINYDIISNYTTASAPLIK